MSIPVVAIVREAQRSNPGGASGETRVNSLLLVVMIIR